MTNREQKNIVRVVNCFAIFFILRFIEEFLIRPRMSFNTFGLMACGFGIVVLFVYLKMENKSLERIGLLFRRHKIKKGFINAVILNAVPFAVVYPLTFLYLKLNYAYVRPTLYYDKADYCHSNGAATFAIMLIFGLFVSVISAVFYELTFRGLLMQLCSKTFSFAKTNVIQASLYTFWFLISAARVSIFSDGTHRWQAIVALVGFFLVYEFTVAVKLGLCKYASGTLWVCLFDHIAFGYITDTVHIQASTSGGRLAGDYSLYVSLVAYQLISLVIAYIYYQRKKTLIIKAKHEASARRHAPSLHTPESIH